MPWRQLMTRPTTAVTAATIPKVMPMMSAVPMTVPVDVSWTVELVTAADENIGAERAPWGEIETSGKWVGGGE